MIVVQKLNKQLRINEDAKEMYLALGYSVVNEKGEIEEAGQATSLAEIKEENATLKANLAQVLKEKEALNAENADLKAQLEAVTKKTK